MSSRPDHHRIFQSNRAMSAVITLSLMAVGTAIYLSPSGSGSAGGSRPDAFGRPLPGVTTPAGAASSETGPSRHVPEPTVAPSTPRPTPTGSVPGRSSRAPGAGYTPVWRTVRDNTGTVIRREVVYIRTVPGPTTVRTTTTTAGPSAPKRQWCTDFRYQQDAQAAYVANLSDPWGLDGAPGPYNGDGLACLQLPVDPSRAPSTPVAAYQPPPPAAKPALVQPATKYFGVAEDGLPGDTPLFNRLSVQAKKAPSALQWFSYWDTNFEAAKVRASWAHGALPVITWMSVPSDMTSTVASTYTLANIVAGKFDRYLTSYAGAVQRTGLPVAIRFDHEMNGNWYPWSAGLKANQSSDPNAPNLYVQAWRHVWEVFDSVGANDLVIWQWAPVRVDNIKPHSMVSGYKYETTLDEDYPGDQYVDWVGMSAYQYKPTDGWTYEATFRKTLNALKALCGKPIFVSETGATESVSGTTYSAEKARWTALTLAGLAAEPGVVGFSWFNNTVNDVHTVDGVPIQTDWQFTSSQQAQDAFVSGIANPQYSSGVMPDVPTR